MGRVHGSPRPWQGYINLFLLKNKNKWGGLGRGQPVSPTLANLPTARSTTLDVERVGWADIEMFSKF